MRLGTLVRVVVRGFVMIAIALALLAAVPATELGTRSLAGLLDWWAGDRLSIGEVSGRLMQAVQLRDLEVRHRSFDVSAAQVAWSWVPAKLLDGQAYITVLEVDGVRIELHELAATPDDVPPVALAFELAAPSVTMTDITVVARSRGDSRRTGGVLDAPECSGDER